MGSVPPSQIGVTSASSEYQKGFLTKLVIMASIGGFLFGYDTGIVSGAALYFKNDFPDITDEEKELVISLAQLGAFIACLIAGPL